MGLLIKDILRIGTSRLEKAGCMDPKIDAEMLFCFMMGIDKTKLFMTWSNELPDKQCDHYFELLETRASGTPLQYITGIQEFMGLNFSVNENVLIPRQDTEVLVEEVIHRANEAEKKHVKILDLCTGSGAIAIALEMYLNGKIDSTITGKAKQMAAEITASDISSKALEVAKSNAKTIGAKVNFVEGDLFNPFNKRFLKPKFDIIVSNPPYIPSQVIEGLQVEVRDHEPRIALDGGEDGLDFYRAIVKSARDYLAKNGYLVMEIGCDQGSALESLAAENGYEHAEVIKDLAGLDRVAVLHA